MNICLFKLDEISKPLSLRDERAVHLIKVLHKKCGDSFFAGIAGSYAGTATITRLGAKTDADGGSLDFMFVPDKSGLLARARLFNSQGASSVPSGTAHTNLQDRSKPLLPMTLIVGFPRPIQLRRLLRDAASLGCKAVHLTGTELGDKNYMKSTLVERGAAEKMLWDGAVQAGSTYVPRLQMHKTLAECLDVFSGGCGAATDLASAGAQPKAELSADGVADSGNRAARCLAALDNVRPVCSLLAFLQNRADASETAFAGKRHVALAIGSERGWTESERDLLCGRGFTLCGMGERILRTETAAAAACAITAAALCG